MTNDEYEAKAEFRAMRGLKQMSTFYEELESLINKYSIESYSDTPDFILAQYLHDCLVAFSNAMIHRDSWYGVSDIETGEPTSKPEED